jgi:hypothetical protein
MQEETLLQAAAGGRELKLTDRWIRELAERIGDKGDKAVIHGLRGAGSNRQIAASRETVRQWMLRAGHGRGASNASRRTLYDTSKPHEGCPAASPRGIHRPSRQQDERASHQHGSRSVCFRHGTIESRIIQLHHLAFYSDKQRESLYNES